MGFTLPEEVVNMNGKQLARELPALLQGLFNRKRFVWHLP